MPKLSVIVPVYNTEKYLRECIDSILAQTFTDFELILVDDGSTDNSRDVCDAYGQTDGRVCVIHQKNGGVTAARKRGVEVAEGEYISFIDSDDWIDPNMFQDMLIQADLHNADMVLCDMLIERQNEHSVIRSSELTGLFREERLEKQIYRNMLFDFSQNAPGLSLNLWNKLIKSAIVKAAFDELPNDLTYGEDAVGSLVCLLRSKCIFIMENSAFYHYRQADEFLMREQRISLLLRLSNFARNTELKFSQYNFDGVDQLSGYVAQVSLYCARQILVFNKEYTIKEKLRLVRDYFNETHISELLIKAETLIRDRKMRRKIELINRKQFVLLLACFYGKEIILRAKEFLRRK